ncbi:iron uptake porin [Microcoleus sp. CAWBG640]|uniref:iron uptake porin n=1 Tax=Microcoleus sp. CAWBG640 TaxID=2841653 RepID=UPI00312B41B8
MKAKYLLLYSIWGILLASPAAIAETSEDLPSVESQGNVAEPAPQIINASQEQLAGAAPSSLELLRGDRAVRKQKSIGSYKFAGGGVVLARSGLPIDPEPAVGDQPIEPTERNPDLESVTSEPKIAVTGKSQSELSPIIPNNSSNPIAITDNNQSELAPTIPNNSSNTPTATPSETRTNKQPKFQKNAPARAIAQSLNTTPTLGTPTPVNQVVQETENNSASNLMTQVTSVSQLSDVKPTDWAFGALQSLVERYGCIAGYPDGTFRGNRALTRYEFAAGLNACLDQIRSQIGAKSADKITKEDLSIVQRLQEEFAAELATLRGRVDLLEARTTELEANRFTRSTTIFGGEAIFALSQAWGGNPPGEGKSNLAFTNSVRLQTVTTFTGKDRLRIELQSGNFKGRGFAEPSALNTFTSLLSFQSDTDNKIQLSAVEYRFPVLNDRIVVTLRPAGFNLSSVLTANSPFYDNGRGAISRFGEANPILKIGDLDTGVGMDWLIGRRFRLQLAYGARNGSDPGQGFAVGKDNWVAGGQFLFLLGNSAQTGLTVLYGSSPDGRLNTFTGSGAADASGFINQRSNIGAVGGSFQWRVTPRFTFATWGGVMGAYASKTQSGAVSTTFATALGFPDLIQQGDLLGVIVGQPPSLVQYEDFSASTGLPGGKDFSLHVEAFYRFNLSDSVSVTPGFFLVTNPGNFASNNTIYIGTIRTTFRF